MDHESPTIAVIFLNKSLKSHHLDQQTHILPFTLSNMWKGEEQKHRGLNTHGYFCVVVRLQPQDPSRPYLPVSFMIFQCPSAVFGLIQDVGRSNMAITRITQRYDFF